MHWPALLVLLFVSSTFGKSVTQFSEIVLDDLIDSERHHPKVEVEPFSSVGKIRDPRRFYDHGKHKPKNGPLPDPVMISSSPIRINKGNHGYSPKRNPFAKRIGKRQIIVQDIASLQNQQPIYYSPQPQQPQQYTLHQDPATGAIYGTPAPMQIQSVTAVPNHNQMLVLQQDGSYAPISYQNGNLQQYTSKFLSRTGEEQPTDQIAEASIATPAVVTKPKVTIVSHADPKSQQSSKKQEQKSQQQIQYEEAQEALQNVIKQQALQQAQQQRQQEFQQQLMQAKAAQERFQQQAQAAAEVQLQQQQAAQAQFQQQQQQAAQAQFQQQQQQAAQIQFQQQQQQQANEHAQQMQQAAVQNGELPPGSILLAPPGTPALIQSHVQQEHQIPQVVQIQQHPQPQMPQQLPVQALYQANGQNFIVNQKPPTDAIEERVSTGHPHHPPQPNGNFVIRHQTYVTGPGGQMFTVPVPVQAENPKNSAEENNSAENNSNDEGGDEGERERADREREKEEHHHNHRPPPRPINSFMRRVMDAFSVRGDAMERVETNIALPILASTGVFFGLGALAAGWYLSNANREVGILRRTGKPVPPGTPNVKRIRRQVFGTAPEVDQATFFQTIIQQAIEKQQQQYDETGEPIPEVVNTPEPQQQQPQRYTFSKYGKPKPLNRNDVQEETYQTSPNSKVSSTRIQKKSWLGSRQALNFARVFIPAIIIGGAVIAIGVLIFGWYLSGSNREIAFLEPSAYSRRKRDLTTTALTDGWVQRVLTSIHENPYEKEDGQGTNYLDTLPFSSDTSKHNNLEYHANLSDAVVAVSLAVVAFFSLIGIVLAWLFSENEKSNLGVTGPYGFGGWPNNYYRSGRSKRSINDLTTGHLTHNPTFLESILTNLEVSQNSVLKKLQDKAYTKWQETPCAKRIFCDVMSAQGDDTIIALEKRMATFMSMLPESLSSSLSRSLSEVMSAIRRRECSVFICGGHWVDSSIINQPTSTSNQPR